MPLINGFNPKSISENIGIERNAGKPENQSIAIAYSKAREALKAKGMSTKKLLPKKGY